MIKLTKEDFRQIDSHWIYVKDQLHMSIAQNARGEFVLTVFFSVDTIPPATQYPTEPEWERALVAANQVLPAYIAALERE